MSTQEFDIGDLVRLDAAYKNLAGTLIDPGTVTFMIEEPGGAVTTYVYGTDAELVRDGVGLYHVDWPAAAAGVHWTRWESTGNGQAAEEMRFDVRAKRVG